MEIQFYSFPMQQDGSEKIEQALKQLEEREKMGEELAQEELDWMDYASFVLYRST